jgi:putative ABC transport system permease protein
MRIVTMCIRNLTRRKLRTYLSIFGIAAAACIAVAVGATTTKYSTIMIEMNTFFRGQVVVVAKNVLAIQGFPIGGALPQSVTEEIDQIDGVERVVPILFNLGFRPGEASGLLPINASIGLPVEEFSIIVDSSALRSGGRLPLSNSDDDVLIGSSIADQYAASTGSTMNLQGREVTVCGIIDIPSTLLERSVVMSLKLAQSIFDYPMQTNMAIVKPKSGVTEEELAFRIEKRINYVTALTENERNDLTKPIIEVVESWNMTLQVVLLFLMIILVVVVGMMNVSERRKDFATLNAIGAPSIRVFSVVILESSVIGVLGSALGIALGSVASVVLAGLWTNIPYNQFVSDILGIVPPIYMTKVFLIGVGACCFGGLLPALSATRVRIAEVLRAEY